LSISFYREKKCLDKLNSEHVVKLNDVFITENCEVYLELEYCPTDLDKIIREKGPFGSLSLGEVQNYFKQSCLALQYCHSQGVVHRDIKPSNILVSKDGKVKLADFGISICLQNCNKMIDGISPGYKAPEVLFGCKSNDIKSDIWSLGALLYELITGISIFRPKNSTLSSQISSITDILGTPSEEDLPGLSKCANYSLISQKKRKNTLHRHLVNSIDPVFAGAIPLIESILQYNPSNRPDIDSILNHPFLNQETEFLINSNKIEQVRNQYQFSTPESSPEPIRPAFKSFC
jgi:serine/threonine protein kinase